MANFDIFPPSGDPPAAVLTLPKNTNAADLTGKILQGANDYYSALAQINTAKYGSKIVKAQAQAALAQARAGGANAAEVARIGLPSPGLLLVGGLGLAALLILKR